MLCPRARLPPGLTELSVCWGCGRLLSCLVPKGEKHRLVLGQRQLPLSWMPQLAAREQLPVFSIST